jgi:hypothetical protein
MTMSSDHKNKPGEEKKTPLPSSGEGADSALDVLRKRREQAPPASDPTIPLRPPAKK